MRRATILIHTYGTIPKYGKRVYKVGPSGAPFLCAAGWELLHATSQYIYLQAPDGVNGARPTVELLIPDRAEVEALANERHQAKVPWAGKLGEWAADYTPRRTRQSTITTLSTFEPEARETHNSTYPAQFRIGVLAVWHAVLFWENGDDAVPRWHEGRDQIVSEQPYVEQNTAK